MQEVIILGHSGEKEKLSENIANITLSVEIA